MAIMRIHSGCTVLFIGDSITDVGRDRSNGDGLGGGYPALIDERLMLSRGHHDVRVLNRGISGNRVCDLVERWDADCLELKPDVISILVGINDTNRCFDSDDAPTVQNYQNDYRTILQRARDANPDVQFVLIEPFLLPVSDEQRRRRVELDPRIAVVHRVVTDFSATLVAADALFARAAAASSPEAWCPDGVHPSPAGHTLLTEAWLDVTDED